MKSKLLFRKLANQFPKRIAWSRDRIGLMVGPLPEEINKILLCLDFDEEVLPLAIKEKPDLILTHHPFIFGTKSSVFKRDQKKKELFDAISKEGIAVYSMHTNFDTGKGGMNDALAEALCLENIKPLETCPMARGGELPVEMEVTNFVKYTKKQLNCNFAWLINEGTKAIKKVAIIGGGGSYNYVNAQAEGYDIYISGDSAHHTRRDIVRDKFNFLELPHEVERIFIPTMAKIISNFDNSIEIIQVDHEKEPILI